MMAAMDHSSTMVQPSLATAISGRVTKPKMAEQTNLYERASAQPILPFDGTPRRISLLRIAATSEQVTAQSRNKFRGKMLS